jgi:hypothetical protein
MPCEKGSALMVYEVVWQTGAYLGHDGLSIFADDISEWHLSALVLVCPDFRVIDIRDLINRDCGLSESFPSRQCYGILLRS